MIALLAALLMQSGGRDLPSSIAIERIEAHLFYEETGLLSEDLLARANGFTGWNTIIGEGDAKEHANDMLVLIRMQADKFTDDPEKLVSSPVSVTVANAKKVLASRTWADVLTSEKGIAVLPLWVRDVGCAGDIYIKATFNGRVKSGHLSFNAASRGEPCIS